MKRIPRHVIARNRAMADADANAEYYAPPFFLPEKTGGPCQLCGKPEREHFAGSCEDWRPYTPPEVSHA